MSVPGPGIGARPGSGSGSGSGSGWARAGAQLGPYLVTGVLGRGGMGVVYRARHVGLGREAALKLLVGSRDPQAAERLRREAQTLARLDHPGIVGVYDLGQAPGGGTFIAMELVDGASLDRLIAAGALPLPDRLRVVAEAARAAHFAHEQGVVHRDIKPANILVDRAGRAKLVDFGLGKSMNGQHPSHRLTATGAFLGTLAYVAPEQVRGEAAEVSPATDVYSLGATLYEAVTGAPPLDAGENAAAAVYAILERTPPPPSSRAELPRSGPGAAAAIDAICARALAKRPSERPASAAELAAEIEGALRGEIPRASNRPRRRRSIRRETTEQTGARRLGPRAALALAAVAIAAVSFGGAVAIGLAVRGARTTPAPTPEPGSVARTAPARSPTASPASAPASLDPQPEPEPPAPATPAQTWWTPSPEQLAAAAEPGHRLWWESSIGLRFVIVPAGTFTMGSPLDEPGRAGAEVPHSVTLTRSYYVSATEVSNAQLRRFRPGHDSGAFQDVSANGDEQPATTLTWEDARAFAAWLSEQEGAPGLYRLPTEAEWEHMARAGTSTARFWGDDLEQAHLYANGADPVTRATLAHFARDGWPHDDGHRGTAPVGRYRPNPWGLFDVIGNAWEWCDDFLGAYPSGPVTDPVGEVGGRYGVMRGGSWFDAAQLCRSATRARVELRSSPHDGGPFRDQNVGFRLVAVRVSPRAR